MTLRKGLSELITLLKSRHCEAYVFFETVLKDLDTKELQNDAVERLANCYSITQYADFTTEEEAILENIISLL